ncbi:MAG: hypothetical protein ACYCSS_12350 [Sulfuriferula sp.]
MESTEVKRDICHPATAVVLWLFFMISASSVDVRGLTALTALVSLGLIRRTRQQFLRYVRRSRWLLLVLLLVHAYSLPGAPILSQLGVYSPSQPGLYGALIQTWRLLLILASLAVLMTRLTREALLSGLYRLFTPLRYLGVEPERLAVRIWLTMGYAEGLMHDTRHLTFKQRIEQMFCLPPVPDEQMQALVLPEHTFNWTDYMCLLGAMTVGIWLRKF